MAIILLALLAAFIAWRARQLGYSAVAWFVTTFLAPLVAIGMLGILPDRSARKKRQRETDLLEAQLAQAGAVVTDGVQVPRETVSDLRTIRN